MTVEQTERTAAIRTDRRQKLGTDDRSEMSDSELEALLKPRAYSNGASATLRVGPMPDVGPIADTPPDWAQSKVWADWEPLLWAVAGESHHRESFDALLGSTGDGLFPKIAALVREPTNQHDPNAIKVEIDTRLVGYIKKELAAAFARPLDDAGCRALLVPAVIFADPQQDSRHVWLWLRRRLSDGPDLPIPVEFADANEVLPPSDDEEDIVPGPDPIIDRFHELDNDAGQAWSDRDLDRLLHDCGEIFTIIEEYVAAVRRGEDALIASLREIDESLVPEEPRQALSSIRALAHGGPVLAAMGRREELIRMWETLDRVGAQHLLGMVDGYLDQERLCEKVLAYVSANPDVVQKDLSSIMGEERSDVSEACWLLALVGRLGRTKKGSSYVLSSIAF